MLCKRLYEAKLASCEGSAINQRLRISSVWVYQFITVAFYFIQDLVTNVTNYFLSELPQKLIHKKAKI